MANQNVNNHNKQSFYYLAKYYKQNNDFENMVKYCLKVMEINLEKKYYLIILDNYINDDIIKYYLI
jgi:hypothetical protein